MIFQYNEYPHLRGKNLYKKYEHDAGWDICTPRELKIAAKESIIVNTGLHLFVPKGLKGIIQSRSGCAFNERLEASNAGVIDAGFTGECGVCLYNNSNIDLTYIAGERIAQIVFDTSLTVSGWEMLKLYWRLFTVGIPWSIPEIPLSEWPITDRGKKGYGSTGRI